MMHNFFWEFEFQKPLGAKRLSETSSTETPNGSASSSASRAGPSLQNDHRTPVTSQHIRSHRYLDFSATGTGMLENEQSFQTQLVE